MSVPVQDQDSWISQESAGKGADLKPRRGTSIPHDSRRDTFVPEASSVAESEHKIVSEV